MFSFLLQDKNFEQFYKNILKSKLSKDREIEETII